MISCGLPAPLISSRAGAAPHSAVGMILNCGILRPPSVVDSSRQACRRVGEEGEGLDGFRLGPGAGQISHLVPRSSRCGNVADVLTSDGRLVHGDKAWTGR